MSYSLEQTKEHTVALERDFYIKKVDKLLNSNTYIRVNNNPTKKIKKTLNNTLKSWFEHKYINKTEFFLILNFKINNKKINNNLGKKVDPNRQWLT